MMTYEDVDLVSSALGSSSLLLNLNMIVYTYGLYINHPPSYTMGPNNNSTFNGTQSNRKNTTKNPGISATAVALIVAGIVIILIVLLGICITKSFRCTTGRTVNNKQSFTE